MLTALLLHTSAAKKNKSRPTRTPRARRLGIHPLSGHHWPAPWQKSQRTSKTAHGQSPSRTCPEDHDHEGCSSHSRFGSASRCPRSSSDPPPGRPCIRRRLGWRTKTQHGCCWSTVQASRHRRDPWRSHGQPASPSHRSTCSPRRCTGSSRTARKQYPRPSANSSQGCRRSSRLRLACRQTPCPPASPRRSCRAAPGAPLPSGCGTRPGWSCPPWHKAW
mmetsp:Transcript_31322/g.75033  ORF Transcript_31322/g.75033 Transcript_31322/m.75033 type:complete len:219 (+) Transcript_31322:97-753(+)